MRNATLTGAATKDREIFDRVQSKNTSYVVSPFFTPLSSMLKNRETEIARKDEITCSHRLCILNAMARVRGIFIN